MTSDDTAYLYSRDGYTVFAFRGRDIRFKAPYSLARYLNVTTWDDCYIVVDTEYSHSSEPIEEYIDLHPILEDLHMDPDEFLEPIKRVVVSYP